MTKTVQWDTPSEAFNKWWDGEYDDSTNPFTKDTFGYWAFAGWQSALAQPAQEPVSWAVVGDGKFGEYELGQVFVDYEATHTYWENRGYELVPVYTTPPQRTWVDLTPQDLNAIFAIARTGEHAVRLALDKIKEKNNGT